MRFPSRIPLQQCNYVPILHSFLRYGEILVDLNLPLRAEMYAGRVVCWRLMCKVEYARRALVRLEKRRDRQTDRKTDGRTSNPIQSNPIQSNVMLRAQEFLSAHISNNITLSTNR